MSKHRGVKASQEGGPSREGKVTPLAGGAVEARTMAVPAIGDDSASSKWAVVDDFPDFIPVMRAEIDVLEVYLAELLDELLGGGHAAE